MQEYSKIAKDYPELIEKYNLEKNAIKVISSGDSLPYDPVIETPDGKSQNYPTLKAR